MRILTLKSNLFGLILCGTALLTSLALAGDKMAVLKKDVSIPLTQNGQQVGLMRLPAGTAVKVLGTKNGMVQIEGKGQKTEVKEELLGEEGEVPAAVAPIVTASTEGSGNLGKDSVTEPTEKKPEGIWAGMEKVVNSVFKDDTNKETDKEASTPKQASQPKIEKTFTWENIKSVVSNTTQKITDKIDDLEERAYKAKIFTRRRDTDFRNCPGGESIYLRWDAGYSAKLKSKLIELKINDNMIGQWVVDPETTWMIEELSKNYVRLNIGGKLIEINKNFDPLPIVPTETQQGKIGKSDKKTKKITSNKTTSQPVYSYGKESEYKLIELPITLETNPAKNSITPGDRNAPFIKKNNLEKFTELPTPLPGITVDWFSVNDIDYKVAKFAYLSTGEFPFGKNGEKIFSRRVEDIKDVFYTDCPYLLKPRPWIYNPLTILSSNKSVTSLKYKNIKITIPTKDILPYIVDAPLLCWGDSYSLIFPKKGQQTLIVKKTVEVRSVYRRTGFKSFDNSGKPIIVQNAWVPKSQVQSTDTVEGTMIQCFDIGQIYREGHHDLKNYLWNTATEPPPRNFNEIRAGYMKQMFSNYTNNTHCTWYTPTHGNKIMGSPENNKIPIVKVEYLHLWE